MQQFNFKVVDARDEDAEVPVSVAGQIMMDVQRLITEMGELLVRQELRTQNSLPEGVGDSFTLRMKGDGGAGSRRDGALLEDVLSMVMAEMDRANLSYENPPETSTHIEAQGRRRLARALLDLGDHLEGYNMTYGYDGSMRRFRLNNRVALEKEAEADITSKVSAAIGVISRDDSNKGRWILSNGIDRVPVTFSDSIPKEEIPKYPGLGPVIVTGTVMLDTDGHMSGVRNVTDCFAFPTVKFHRIIVPGRDLLLFNPVLASPGYDANRGIWTLDNEELGICISKPSWDAAVAAFHEYFMFLWETYAESEDDFEGEEKEVRDFLLSMSFP